MDYESGLPGGETGFRDVTSLFLKAAAGMYLSYLQGLWSFIWKDLEPDNLLFMENFTLQDAMGALEVREISPAHWQVLMATLFLRLANLVWTVVILSQSNLGLLLTPWRRCCLKNFVGYLTDRWATKYVNRTILSWIILIHWYRRSSMQETSWHILSTHCSTCTI